jgi:hypothetical protein
MGKGIYVSGSVSGVSRATEVLARAVRLRCASGVRWADMVSRMWASKEGVSVLSSEVSRRSPFSENKSKSSAATFLSFLYSCRMPYLLQLFQCLSFYSCYKRSFFVCTLIYRCERPQRFQRLLIALEIGNAPPGVFIAQPALDVRPVLGLGALLAGFGRREEVCGGEGCVHWFEGAV